MSEKMFYVVGGEYADTGFTTPAVDKELEVHGPFPQAEAYAFWRNITSQTIDNAMVRYTVKAADEVKVQEYFVIGGEYADPSFSVLAGGKDAEVYGPFDHAQALTFWRDITGRTVDSCLHRYVIEAR
ncbi:DUF4170 domain-containing protein [Insolitispirillum peregrinum]|uniref:DUF4170 domain-containing protein n=1 Tax=Insolitispirillum peregrinum TaxID=80876 RepID=UPI00360BD8FA